MNNRRSFSKLFRAVSLNFYEGEGDGGSRWSRLEQVLEPEQADRNSTSLHSLSWH
jgi:hypothetical protein